MAYPKAADTTRAIRPVTPRSPARARPPQAFFDESYVIPPRRLPDRDGLTLEDWTGVARSRGEAEINKLASNCSLARDTAGVHYRQDGVQGLLLGEQVGIALLRSSGRCTPSVRTGSADDVRGQDDHRSDGCAARRRGLCTFRSRFSRAAAAASRRRLLHRVGARARTLHQRPNVPGIMCRMRRGRSRRRCSTVSTAFISSRASRIRGRAARCAHQPRHQRRSHDACRAAAARRGALGVPEKP